LFFSVSLALVKHVVLPVRSCLTKGMFMLLFASYSRKLAVLTSHDLTMLSDAPVRVALHGGRLQHVYVYSAYVSVPYVTAHLRTPTKFEQVVTAQSTVNPYGSYVVPSAIDIDVLSLTPAKHGLLSALTRKYELLHFGYVTQWETFRRLAFTHHVLCHEDASLPKQILL
jgi:hypothetical protein